MLQSTQLIDHLRARYLACCLCLYSTNTQSWKDLQRQSSWPLSLLITIPAD